MRASHWEQPKLSATVTQRHSRSGKPPTVTSMMELKLYSKTCMCFKTKALDKRSHTEKKAKLLFS